jgi:thiamine-monophosphate kinase
VTSTVLHLAMAGGREFDAIRELLAIWGDVAVGIGDDAAVLVPPTDASLVVSTDACIEHVHFRSDWLTPYEIGGRAATAALSDLAAMGARAQSVLVSLTVPQDWRARLGEVARGIGDVVRMAGGRIVGGNISRSQTFGITLTAIGAAVQPVSRRGAQPGDMVFVTGVLGGPGAALDAFTRGHTPADWLRTRFASPVPRLAEGEWLAARGVTAMIDISDGLHADVAHLARASDVEVVLDATRIPCGLSLTPAEALASGEEYELLGTAPAGVASALGEAFAREFALPLTWIGAVEARTGAAPVRITGIAAERDARVEIAGGHDHFTG